MNDLHVEELRYRFYSERPTDRFFETASLSVSLGQFIVELSNANLIVRPQRHYTDEYKARADFEPLLRSWEESSFLDYDLRIRFTYEQAKVTEYKPSIGKVVVRPFSTNNEIPLERPEYIRDWEEYPAPNPTFMSSNLTEALIILIKRYRDGREGLIPIATKMLSWLEQRFKGLNGTAHELNISISVLNQLRYLCNTSDPKYGITTTGDGPTHLSPANILWIEKVVVRLTRRVGEVNAGVSPLSFLTMPDFHTS